MRMWFELFADFAGKSAADLSLLNIILLRRRFSNNEAILDFETHLRALRVSSYAAAFATAGLSNLTPM